MSLDNLFGSASQAGKVSSAHTTTRYTPSSADGCSPPILPKGRRRGPQKTIICRNCGKVMQVPLAKMRALCSSACMDAERAAKRAAATSPCATCSKPVYRTPGHRRRSIKAGAIFCSVACSGEMSKGQNNPQFKGGKKALKCANCGGVFFSKPSESKRRKCCSASCASKMARGRREARMIARRCLACGLEFRVKHQSAQYCGKDCADRAHSERMRGERNGRYMHGNAARPYPAGWTRTFKTKIRDRDGNHCRVCCAVAPDGAPALHVHHIDYDKKNLSEGNLITVCKFCHGTMHGNARQREEWALRLSSMLNG